MKGYWILSCFFCIYEMIVWFLSFVLLMCCIIFIDFHTWKHPCITGMNPTWSGYMIFLLYFQIWFVGILLKIFTSVFIKDMDLRFSFFVVSIMVWIWNVLQSLCVKGLIPPATVFIGRAFGRWLDHESSDLINGLIYWWTYNLMDYCEVVET